MADARLTPARGDIAARHLQGQVEAARFVDGVARVVIAANAPVRREPSHQAALETEALHGERITVYEFGDEGWAWGQLDADGYVGFMPSAALGMPGASPTHRVAALRTFAFPGPSIKLPPVDTLSLGARLAIARMEAGFAVTEDRRYLPAQHVAPLATHETDFVAVAERFAGTPYLWGGKTSLGIDCSGLVQVALGACGMSAPRDSDMQAAGLGDDVPLAGWHPQRGDAVFWKGHVALLRDPTTIVHANAHHMAVAVEPLAAAVGRAEALDSPIIRVRRLPGLSA